MSVLTLCTCIFRVNTPTLKLSAPYTYARAKHGIIAGCCYDSIATDKIDIKMANNLCCLPLHF